VEYSRDVVIICLRNICLFERLWGEPLMAVAIIAEGFMAMVPPVIISAAAILLNSTNVFAEQQIESPIERDAKFFIQAGQLTQVNRAPKPPGKKAGEVDSDDACHAGSAANRGEQPDRLK
jgi:hypothetical protein